MQTLSSKYTTLIAAALIAASASFPLTASAQDADSNGAPQATDEADAAEEEKEEDAPAADATSEEAPAESAPSEDEPTEDEANGSEANEGAPTDESGEEDLDDLDDLMEDEGEGVYDRLDKIEVTYTPEEIAKTGGSAHIMDEEDLEEFEHDDVHSILPEVTGVYIRQEDGFGLRPNIGIRGANSERSKKVTLMEDSVLFGPAPYSAPAAYYFPLVTRMSALEVFKGPGSILYGPQTIGGAINFVTRPVPNGMDGGVDLAIGSYPSGKLHVWHGMGNDRAGFLIEGTQLASAGFKELDSGGPTGFDRSEVMLKAHVNSDPTKEVFHKLSVKATYSRELSNETYLGLSDEDFAKNPYRRYASSELDQMKWWRFASKLDYRLELGESFNLTTSVYRHDFSRSWKKFNQFNNGPTASDLLEDPNGGRRELFYRVLTGEVDSSTDDDELIIGTNARDFISQGVQTLARHQIEKKNWSNRLEAGVRVHYDEIIRDHTEERYAMRSGRLERTDDPTAQATNNHDSSVAVAAWLVDQVSFWRATITPGVRVERIANKRVDLTEPDEDAIEGTQAIAIPGLGAYFDITEELGFLAGVHRGFSPVSPGQGDDVSPETSVNYEAGFRYTGESNSGAELIGFFSDYRNLLGQCTFAAGCTEENLDDQFNAGRARIYGAEVLGEHDFIIKGKIKIPVGLSYTFTQTEFLTGFDSLNPQFSEVEPGDELPYVPQHQLSARAGFVTPKVTVNLGTTYASPMREEASQGDEGRKTDAYVGLDALAAYNFSFGSSVYLKGDNLLNAQPIASRRPFGARTIRPRFVMLGFKHKWPNPNAGAPRQAPSEEEMPSELPDELGETAQP